MFQAVSSRVSFPQMEADILQFWKDKDVFRRTESERPDAPLFMMYEGPPTANGSPGIHHVLARVFKDVICRYRTMKGYRVMRKGGWDTHGLAVELEVEKSLGLATKRDIEEHGIELYVDRKSYIFLAGTSLEYSGGLNGKGFVFNNPNAKTTCGCGTSFSV